MRAIVPGRRGARLIDSACWWPPDGPACGPTVARALPRRPCPSAGQLPYVVIAAHHVARSAEDCHVTEYPPSPRAPPAPRRRSGGRRCAGGLRPRRRAAGRRRRPRSRLPGQGQPGRLRPRRRQGRDARQHVDLAGRVDAAERGRHRRRVGPVDGQGLPTRCPATRRTSSTSRRSTPRAPATCCPPRTPAATRSTSPPTR